MTACVASSIAQYGKHGFNTESLNHHTITLPGWRSRSGLSVLFNRPVSLVTDNPSPCSHSEAHPQPISLAHLQLVVFLNEPISSSSPLRKPKHSSCPVLSAFLSTLCPSNCLNNLFHLHLCYLLISTCLWAMHSAPSTQSLNFLTV